MTITMIMQMAKAVPSIEITLNSLFSPIILNACLMYCFIINLCIIIIYYPTKTAIVCYHPTLCPYGGK